MRVHFGEFTLDRDSRQLWRGHEELRLVPKAFDLLDLLLSQRPRAVSKDRIRDRIWPKTFVSESTLTSLVVDLRAVLNDRAKKPLYVRTVHGLGYAFCGTATESAQEVSAGGRRPRLLRLPWGDRAIPLSEGQNLLGRVDGAAAWMFAVRSFPHPLR